MDDSCKSQINTYPEFTSKALPQSIIPKLNPIINILNSDQINIQQLKHYLRFGIPDEANVIRQFAWKVVLGSLPKERKKWMAHAQKQDAIYNQFVRQFLHPEKYRDYPLLKDKNRRDWKQFEQDYYLWEQIEKDTCRTQAQLSFFSMKTKQIQIPFYTNTRKQKYRLIKGSQQVSASMSKEEAKQTYRYDYMTRILFIFGRLNPKIEYVQGMNEILAPIFYVVNSPHGPHEKIQEAAVFYMFNNVMTDILQLHMQDFGKKQNGIHERMKSISTMLLAVQPKVWYRFEVLKIDPFYYCFRWITLLFSQQFQMFDTLRLWESIFSHQQRTVFINYFALAMIVASKQAVVNLQYGQILSYLKTISENINLELTIGEAQKYYFKYNIKQLTSLAEKNRKKLYPPTSTEGNRLVKFFKKLF